MGEMSEIERMSGVSSYSSTYELCASLGEFGKNKHMSQGIKRGALARPISPKFSRLSFCLRHQWAEVTMSWRIASRLCPTRVGARWFDPLFSSKRLPIASWLPLNKGTTVIQIRSALLLTFSYTGFPRSIVFSKRGDCQSIILPPRAAVWAHLGSKGLRHLWRRRDTGARCAKLHAERQSLSGGPTTPMRSIASLHQLDRRGFPPAGPPRSKWVLFCSRSYRSY